MQTYSFEVNGVTFSYEYFDECSCHTHHMSEEKVRNAVWDIRDGMYVVDMGAGCGDYTMTAAIRGGDRCRVYAFEPDPESFSVLRQNIVFNKWQERCVLSRLALSSNERESFLNKTTHTLTEDSLQYPVKVSTLDKFIDALSIAPPRLDWIKIDVELEELEVAKGMVKTVRRYRPKILIEIHSPNTIKQFLSILDAGYSAESLVNYIDACDNSYWLCTKH